MKRWERKARKRHVRRLSELDTPRAYQRAKRTWERLRKRIPILPVSSIDTVSREIETSLMAGYARAIGLSPQDLIVRPLTQSEIYQDKS